MTSIDPPSHRKRPAHLEGERHAVLATFGYPRAIGGLREMRAGELPVHAFVTIERFASDARQYSFRCGCD
jgi:hypothetical protein